MPRSSRHTRRLEATKELFFDLSAADGGGSVGAFGGGLVDDPNDDAWIVCHIPWNFHSLKEIAVVLIPIATLTPMTIRVVTNYCRKNAICTEAGETIDRGINVEANKMTELNIADAVDGHKLADCDYLGVNVRKEANQNTNALILGVRIKYDIPTGISAY
jgi:hypothetical protein